MTLPGGGPPPPPPRYALAPIPIAGVDPALAAVPPSELKIAAVWRRAAASLLDQLLIGFLQGFALLIFAMVSWESFLQDHTLGKWVIAGSVIASLVALLYMQINTGRARENNGLTFGLGIANARITARDGLAISKGQAMIRAIVTMLPTALAYLSLSFLLSGAEAQGGTDPEPPDVSVVLLALALAITFADVFLAPVFGTERRMLRDRLSNTVVVDYLEGRPLPPPQPVPVERRRRNIFTWLLAAVGLVELAFAVVLFASVFAA